MSSNNNSKRTVGESTIYDASGRAIIKQTQDKGKRHFVIKSPDGKILSEYKIE